MKTIKDIFENAAINHEYINESKCLKDDCEEFNILKKEYPLEPGVSFVVSRPGVGKTTFALDIVLEQALKNDASIFIFSPEKTAEEVAERLLDKIKCHTSHSLIQNFLNICIEDFKDNTLDAVRQIEKLIETTCKECFVLVDSLDCLWTNGRGKKITFKERARLSDKLSELAKKRNIKLLVSNYVTKEDFESLVCGELPQYLKSVNTILLLDRQSYFLDDEFYTKSELQIISSGNTKTKIELDYNEKLRRFVRR